jgi:peptide/nickel transport system substrate-binding protein
MAAARELELPLIRTIRSIDRTHIVSVLLLGVSFLISQSCTPSNPAPVPSAAPVTLTIGYPHVTGQDSLIGMQQAARLISSEGLVLASRDGRVQPKLAQRWTESADGLSWRFELRPNAFFHDGSPVNSTVVKASLERSLANADKDQYPGLADIVSIEAPTVLEIVIRVQTRSTFLLDDLGVSIQKIETGKQPVVAGPYVPRPPTGNDLTMTAFPQYYRGKPQIDHIIWKAYPTVRTAWAAMMRREIDFLYEVGEDARQFVEGESSTEVFPFLRNYVYSVAFNLKRPTFIDDRIRRALNHAVNRSAIVERAFKMHGLPTSGSAWPEHWAFDPTVTNYAYDPARATALLDSALNGQASLQPGRPPSRLRFTCILPENFTLWERMALLVQRDLAHVGVDMQLETVSVNDFTRRVMTGDFDAVLIELIVGNTPTKPYTFWYSQSKRDFTGYKNADVDAALDAIRHAPNDMEYRRAFRAYQNALFEDPPAVFLAFGEVTRAVSKRFQVIAPPRSDILPTIADWRLANTSPRVAN